MRYKQTAIGMLWAVLRPVLTTAVFVVVFGAAGQNAFGRRALSLAGFCRHVAVAILRIGAHRGEQQRLVLNANMISEDLLSPIDVCREAPCIVALSDFAISLVILACTMGCYRILPSWHLVFLIPAGGNRIHRRAGRWRFGSPL